MSVNRYRWIRVTKKRHCVICDKPDYCTYAPEADLVLCMRIESDKPSTNSLGGWLHSTGDARQYVAPVPKRKAIEDPPLNPIPLWRRWFEETDHEHLDGFAMSLGVDTDALRAIGCAWAGKEWQDDLSKRSWATEAWAFPMFNEHREMIGLRLRADGMKWAVKGSRSGLFLPNGNYSTAISERGTLWLVEGPSDLAAALTIGLNAIGRPAARAQADMVLDYVRIQETKRMVIIADNDPPDKLGTVAGFAGAESLQERLRIPSAILLLPTKDVREFTNLGGDFPTMQSMLADLVWEQPRL